MAEGSCLSIPFLCIPFAHVSEFNTFYSEEAFLAGPKAARSDA